MGRVFLCKASLWESWDSSARCVWVCVLGRVPQIPQCYEGERGLLSSYLCHSFCMLCKISGSERYLRLQARWRSWDMWYVITVSALSHYQSTWQYFLVSCFGKKAYALSTNVIRLLSGTHIFTHTQTDVYVNHLEKQMNICKSLAWEGEYDNFECRGWWAYGRSMACYIWTSRWLLLKVHECQQKGGLLICSVLWIC